jgi:flagellar biosynthesis protein FliR
MTKEFVIYLLVGELIIYTTQNFPLQSLPYVGPFFDEKSWLGKLVSCSFCLGFWIYFGLSIPFQANALWFYIPVLSEFLTGLIAAFIMHIFMIGLKDKFSILEIK